MSRHEWVLACLNPLLIWAMYMRFDLKVEFYGVVIVLIGLIYLAQECFQIGSSTFYTQELGAEPAPSGKRILLRTFTLISLWYLNIHYKPLIIEMKVASTVPLVMYSIFSCVSYIYSLGEWLKELNIQRLRRQVLHR